MTSKISFEFCGESKGDTMNIFIHGYSAAFNDSEKDKLKQYVASLDVSNTNVFAFWPSGSIYDGLFDSHGVLAIFKLSPYVLLTHLVAGQVENFKKIENHISHIKYEFFILLKRFLSENNGQYKTINVYSHSLGARLIIESIIGLETEYTDIGINHLVFMAGARDLSEKECEKVLDVISGNIYNIYSSNDYVLKIKPDLEQCIGIHKINSSEKCQCRVHNYPFNALGHTDYWTNIKEIIKYLDFDNTSGKELITGQGESLNSFSSGDSALYNVIYFATMQEKYIISSLLNKRDKSFNKEAIDQGIITNEIQLMGGDSIANRMRGHGVKYERIINDACDSLGVNNYEAYDVVKRESIIYDLLMNDLHNKVLKNNQDSDKFRKILDLFSHYKNGRAISYDDIDIFDDIYSLTSKLTIRSLYFTGPANSVLIPIILVVKIIRERILKKEQYLAKYISGAL